ncbi:MAG: hypothetical protein C0606_04010 [Hyphomicrobiales bacterium]|nr:MAG: hypothetical protein C0606_04010 [Hyphomicrobiales bacterium]
MKTLFAWVVVCVSLLPATASAAWSTWVSSDEYQAIFERHLSQQRYPARVEARLSRGAVQYRADFRPFPWPGFNFASHHGWDDNGFARKNRQYRNRGMNLTWHNRIIVRGRAYNQGTWVLE